MWTISSAVTKSQHHRSETLKGTLKAMDIPTLWGKSASVPMTLCRWCPHSDGLMTIF